MINKNRKAFTPLEKKPTIKNRHSLTGFTLLEVIIALILASVLTIGSIKVIENMQHETERFRQQVDDDMTWLTANHHLAKNVRGSSYLEVSNGGNTLTLYNYDQTPKGVYVNDPVGHRITYNSIVAGTTTTFQNVTATFSPPSPGTTGQGWRSNRNIEVVIDYALPFVNMLRLRCAADVKSSSTWAVTYYSLTASLDTSEEKRNKVIPAKDGSGYIALATVCAPNDIGNNNAPHYPYVLKIDNNGDHVWSRLLDNTGHIAFANDIVENPGGTYTILVTKSGGALYLVELSSSGALVSSKRVGNVGYQLSGVSMIRTSAGGYAILAKRYVTGDPLQQRIYVIKTNNAGIKLWERLIRNPNYVPGGSNDSYGIQVFPYQIIEYFTTAGAPIGYAIVGGAIGPEEAGNLGYNRIRFEMGLNTANGGDLWDPLIISSWLHIRPPAYSVYDYQIICITQSFLSWSTPVCVAYFHMGGWFKSDPPLSGMTYYARKFSLGYGPEWWRFCWGAGLLGQVEYDAKMNSMTPTLDGGLMVLLTFSDNYIRYEFGLIKFEDNMVIHGELNRYFLGENDISSDPAAQAKGPWTWYTVQQIPGGGLIAGGPEILFSRQDGGVSTRFYIVKTDANGECPGKNNPVRHYELPSSIPI